MTDARDVATRVLARVTDEGAFAAAALSAELGRARLDRRDAALATEIVYGSLRVLPALDAALNAHLKRPITDLEPHTRAALRCAAYQIEHLARVPAHAAVDAAVRIVKKKRGPKLAGLANAVLRKVAATRPDDPAPPSQLIVPQWLTETLRSSLGEDRAAAFLEARPLPPPIGLRCKPGAWPQVNAFEEGTVSPLAVLVRGVGDPRELPGYAEGHFAVQEQGAQVVALLAGARPGERVVDACAGRGGKTTLLAEQVGDEGRVVAMDLHEPKLERLREELARLHVPAERVETRAVDLTVGTAGIEGTMDRVLVDAPCTGLGTVHRRPEILLRTGPDDPARMAVQQLAILKNAARMLRPGGTLIYAVCSPAREEGAGVAAAVAREMPQLVLLDEPWPLDTVAPDPDGIVRIGPWNGDCDAYQIMRFCARA